MANKVVCPLYTQTAACHPSARGVQVSEVRWLEAHRTPVAAAARVNIVTTILLIIAFFYRAPVGELHAQAGTTSRMAT